MKYLSALKNLMTAILQRDGGYIAKCWGWLVREAKYDIGRVRFVVDIGWYKGDFVVVKFATFEVIDWIQEWTISIIDFQFLKFIVWIALDIKE